MKFTRKFVPALALLIVSAVLMTTATFAWFSMNTRVTATGMQMDTEAGDNILISDSGLTKVPTDATQLETFNNTFKNTFAFAGTMANLRPVSSANGADFYYAGGLAVDGNGEVFEGSTYSKYDSEDLADFKANYGIPAGSTAAGYVEYKFLVMATNDGDAAKNLVIDQLDLTYGGSANVQKAFRAAVFADEVTTAADVSTETLKTILSIKDATYHDAGKAVNSTSTKDTVSSLNADAILANIPAGETKYYKVVVRVWLEGEDKTCTNKTFAKLDETWSLDLAISFADSGVTPVKNLNSLPAGTP